MKRNNKKGFTIVELVIVIAVIAILAGVLIPTFTGIIKKSQDSAILQEMRAALTVILAEEDSQMDSKSTYVFVYAKKPTELVYYKYDHTEKKVVLTTATGANVADGKITLDANDVVWYETADMLSSAKVDATAITDTDNKVALEDLDSIVVVKIVPGTN